MVEIRNKILEADAIVLASPVYYYSVCAQLKLVIDRCYAFGYEQLTVSKSMDGGMVLATNAGEHDSINAGIAMKQAYELGRGV